MGNVWVLLFLALAAIMIVCVVAAGRRESQQEAAVDAEYRALRSDLHRLSADLAKLRTRVDGLKRTAQDPDCDTSEQ